VSGATRPRLRDCPASVRELRACERALCGLHQLDRTLHAFWERLPLHELRIVGTVAVLGVGVYLVVVRRGSIEHSLTRVGSAQPGWIAVAVAAELVSLVCYAALVRVLLQLGAVTVPFRALFSLTVIGIAMINSVPGGQGGERRRRPAERPFRRIRTARREPLRRRELPGEPSAKRYRSPNCRENSETVHVKAWLPQNSVRHSCWVVPVFIEMTRLRAAGPESVPGRRRGGIWPRG
jgi:hypothetical protein